MTIEDKIDKYLNEKKAPYFIQVSINRGNPIIKREEVPAIDPSKVSKDDIIKELEDNLMELEKTLKDEQDTFKRYKNEKPISAEGDLVKRKIRVLKSAVKEMKTQLKSRRR